MWAGVIKRCSFTLSWVTSCVAELQCGACVQWMWSKGYVYVRQWRHQPITSHLCQRRKRQAVTLCSPGCGFYYLFLCSSGLTATMTHCHESSSGRLPVGKKITEWIWMEFNFAETLVPDVYECALLPHVQRGTFLQTFSQIWNTHHHIHTMAAVSLDKCFSVLLVCRVFFRVWCKVQGLKPQTELELITNLSRDSLIPWLEKLIESPFPSGENPKLCLCMPDCTLHKNRSLVSLYNWPHQL